MLGATALVFLVLAGVTATRLAPKLTWMDLLPQDEPKVIEFEKVLEQFGSTEMVLVAIEGPDPERLTEFARRFERLALELTSGSGEQLVGRVTWSEDMDFIADHALMLTEDSDLQVLLDSGIFDGPGLLPFLLGYNRSFQAEYVDEGDEGLESEEGDAVRAIDSMWNLPRALRWYLENELRTDDDLRPEIEQMARTFAIGEERFFSDDRSMLLMLVQPTTGTNQTNMALITSQYLRDAFESLLEEYPAIADHYAGPWPTTRLWRALYPRVQDDPVEVDKLRMEVPYKAPAIAPVGRRDGGTGMTGMHVVMEDEYMTMFHDMGWLNLAVFFAVLMLFVGAFRMWTAPVLAMVVLSVAIIMALGLVSLLLGELNMMSMMFPVILLGLGVDYAIHIIGEFTRLRSEGEDIGPAMHLTLQKTGKGILTGGLTTALAFLALGLTSFKGIQHLGISAGLGVLCTLATSFLVLPAGLVVIHRRHDRRRLRRAAKGSEAAAKPPRMLLEFRSLAVAGSVTHRLWPLTLLVVAAVTGVMLLNATRVEWARDMLSIEAEGLASLSLNDVLEERFHIQPDTLVVSAPSLEESYRLTEELDDLPTVRMVDSISNLLPPPHEQAAREPLVAEVAQRMAAWGPAEPFDADSAARFLEALYQLDCNVITLRKSAYMQGMDRLYDKADAIVPEGESCVRRVEGQPRPQGGWPRVAASDDVKAIAAALTSEPERAAEVLTRFQELFEPTLRATFARMANPEPVRLDMLPEDVRDRYESNDGSSYLITVYPRGDVWNEDFQKRFLPQIDGVDERITGTPSLFVATVERGSAEGKRATLYALMAVVLLLVLDFWGFRRGAAPLWKGLLSGLLALVPLAVGAIWMVGSMSLLGIQFNMFNVIAVPLLMGIGIDYGVHVVHRYRTEGPGSVPTVLATTGRAILLTSLTTIAAFGSFAFGLYRGLSGLGVILSVGIAICFALSVFLLPALIRPLELKKVRL
jgi:predicted RND superfamily exporter protein